MANNNLQKKQAMRKLPIPTLPTTAFTTKTSKQKETSEEKQAKKKELDQVTLRGGALEAGFTGAVCVSPFFSPVFMLS